MINRRDLFIGGGAFLGAASAYKTSEAGILLPYDKIISAPIPPWSGMTMITAFEGDVSSFSINCNTSIPVATSLDGRMIGSPIIESYDFSIGFFEDFPNPAIISNKIYVQIFQKYK